MRPSGWLLRVCACWALIAHLAHADPWLPPGQESLRSDIQRLADAGLLRGPVTTWPISWPDVARDVLAVSSEDVDLALAPALMRVQRLARASADTGFQGLGMRVSGAHAPTPLRGFENTPREEGEIGMRASWLSDHLAVNLQATAVADADDHKTWRGDGSYVGVNVGNFMISAGVMERWWGPGWDGSLILSTNARPIPSITIERNYTDPFRTKLLSWLGRWRASIAVGEAEGGDAAVPNVRFLAARVNFKPRPWVEFGLTRTAQWCGGDRNCGWGTFTDMLIGRDNREPGGSPGDEPGNQMAGYDMRMRSPWRRLPVAFYTQWIGEDEAGHLPSKFLGLFGLESWGDWNGIDWRLRAEYADTTCSFTRSDPQFGCAYRNSIYPQGYAYRGRIIGHALDNDSRMFTLAALLSRANGDTLSLALRNADINRDGGDHAISSAPVNLDNVELRYSRGLRGGRLSLGLGYDQYGDAPGVRSGARGFVTWQQGY